MKKKLVSLMMLMSAMSLNAAVTVDRIEPTNWYVGMKDASLQLMVYGKDVRNAEVEVNYPGVRVESGYRIDTHSGVVRLYFGGAHILAVQHTLQ